MAVARRSCSRHSWNHDKSERTCGGQLRGTPSSHGSMTPTSATHGLRGLEPCSAVIATLIQASLGSDISSRPSQSKSSMSSSLSGSSRRLCPTSSLLQWAVAETTSKALLTSSRSRAFLANDARQKMQAPVVLCIFRYLNGQLTCSISSCAQDLRWPATLPCGCLALLRRWPDLASCSERGIWHRTSATRLLGLAYNVFWLVSCNTNSPKACGIFNAMPTRSQIG